MKCAAPSPASAIRRSAGTSYGALWPRSSGIRVSCTHASALLSPTWHGRPRRRLLQPARHLRAVHQGRQERDQMDAPTFVANAVRLQLDALAYNLGNFMRTVAMPGTAQPWSLTSLREKLIKIGAKGRQPRA